MKQLLLSLTYQKTRISTTRKITDYNPVIGQIVTLRLKKRHPHPARNASILLIKYRNTLERYYTSIEKITNPQRYYKKIEYYKLVIRLLRKTLRRLNQCIA